MQESNAQPEEVVARQRAVLVGLAAAAVLVLLALLWWLSADPATETANAPAAARPTATELFRMAFREAHGTGPGAAHLAAFAEANDALSADAAPARPGAAPGAEP